MTKYIVSAPGVVPGEYNHEAVKMAYKAGAVVEHYAPSLNKWIKSSPIFNELFKYRAIITDDMPQEIQDLVNWMEADATPFIQQIGRATRCPDFKFRKPTEAELNGVPGGENSILADIKFIAAPKRHKWADVIIAMAEGYDVEYQREICGRWWPGSVNGVDPFSDPQFNWRIKPRTIMIGDTEIPAPETRAPALDQKYYAPDLLEEQHLYLEYAWDNDSLDKHILASGLLHLDSKSAQEHALALIKLNGGQHPDSYEVAK